MNNQISKGKWKEIKGKIREQWGDLSDDELERTKGNMDQIAGKIQQKYGESIDMSKRKLNTILGHINDKLS